VLTKIKATLWLGVFITIGVIGVSQFGHFGQEPEPLRVHSPTKTAVQQAQVVEFLALWSRDYPPTLLTYWVGNQEVKLVTSQLPVLVGRWSLRVPYDPSLTYAMNVNQTSRDAGVTDCQMTLIPSGFTDSNRVTGRDSAHCWINPAL
jgi:hypothetical protein